MTTGVAPGSVGPMPLMQVVDAPSHQASSRADATVQSAADRFSSRPVAVTTSSIPYVGLSVVTRPARSAGRHAASAGGAATALVGMAVVVVTTTVTDDEWAVTGGVGGVGGVWSAITGNGGGPANVVTGTGDGDSGPVAT